MGVSRIRGEKTGKRTGKVLQRSRGKVSTDKVLQQRTGPFVSQTVPRRKVTTDKTGAQIFTGKVPKQATPSRARPSPPRTKTPKADKPVKTVKTKGGDYKVYKKKSASAQSFREAFRAARKSGVKVFTWRGRKYTTKVK